MLGGAGYYRGSSVLVSGTAGTGKTTLGAQFVNAACGRGERCLFFGFEESLGQITRNMRSVGIDLAPWVQAGLLQYHGTRPTAHGLEMHLVKMHKLIEDFQPSVVVLDPVTSFLSSGTSNEVKGMLTRLIDFLKSCEVTAFMTTLTSEVERLEQTDVHVSSLIDTWFVLRDLESGGERNRGLMILKSRGMAHSNQIREFLLTKNGIELQDVYIGPAGVLAGSARLAQEAHEEAEELLQQYALAEKRRQSERKRKVLEAQIAALQADMAAEEAELQRLATQEELRQTRRQRDRVAMAQMRQADATVAACNVRRQCTYRKAAMSNTLGTVGDLQQESADQTESWNMRLYIAGQTPKSLRALANLKQICEKHLAGKYHIEIIDLLENPQLASTDQILAIPTLIRKLPEPMRKIIGDLSNVERVLVGLDLRLSA